LADAERIEFVPLSSCYYGLSKSSGQRTAAETRKYIRNYVGIKLVNMVMAMSYPIARLGYTSGECWELRREIGKLVVHPHSSRFVQYLDFLRNRSDLYQKVMLTDVRDVYFQTDPFERIPDSELWMFQEEGPETLGSDARNRRWIEATFGRKVLRRIASRPIICAGVTIGGVRNILGYLEVMEPELLSRSPVYLPDQGIHNALAYTGAFDHLRPVIVKNGTGPVVTVGRMSEAQFQWGRNGALVDAAGVPFSVVHQFDRHPSLRSAFADLVGDESLGYDQHGQRDERAKVAVSHG
jgi:hypothetical protein